VWPYRGLCVLRAQSQSPRRGSFPVGVRRRRVGHDGHANDTSAQRPSPECPPRTEKSRIGLIVAGSMAAGLVLAVILVALPFIPGRENVLTGVVLLAFALGWALLTALSVPAHRPAPTMGGCAGRVHGGSRAHFTPSAGLRCAGCVRLGMAASTVRARRLDVPVGPTAATQPKRTVAAVPRPGRADGGLHGRRLRDCAQVARRQALPDARPAGRRGRAPAAPLLHRCGQPYGRPGAGSRRGLLRLWLGRARGGPGQHSVRI
jgi:hypothetical protein